jgi:DNA-binding LacI/PurR family transcriptional regulator
MLPPPHKPITIKDIAHHCGLSLYPVSRVLSGKPGVNEETAARIRAAAVELGYDPATSQGARRLALRKYSRQVVNHLVGVMIPMPVTRMTFFHHLFSGVSETLAMAGFGLVLTHTYNLVTHQSIDFPLPPAYGRGEVDGIIAHGGLSAELLDHLRHRSEFGARPIVSLTASAPGCTAILRDEWGGAYQAAAHLLSLGHRQIGYLRKGPSGYPVAVREGAYRQAFQDAGVDPAGLQPVIIGDLEDEVEEPLRQALAGGSRLTALLALNDPNAISVRYALQRLGVRVPDEISLIGFDDTDPLPDACGQNQLTSVQFPIADMGRTAARLLLEALHGEPSAPRDILVPGTLVVRATTGSNSRSSA